MAAARLFLRVPFEDFRARPVAADGALQQFADAREVVGFERSGQSLEAWLQLPPGQVLLVGAQDTTVPVFDTTAIHARAAVDFALGGA